MTSGHRDKDGIADAALRGVVGAIMPTRASTEDTFLAVGQSLEASSGILTRLTATFDALLQDLQSEDLKRATADIASAASGVAAICGSYRSERETLDALTQVAARIDGHILRMRKAVKTVDVLGVSARIEVTHIGDTEDFRSFARDIDRALKLAQVNLMKLGREIDAVRAHIDEANAGEHAFDRQHAEALRLLPPRLMASVDSIAAHREQAIGATAAVAERSRHIARRVSEAVMALQIGDITRQRIEHVEDAVALIDDIACAEAAGAWQDLGMLERQDLVALGCRLQAAQLDAAAQDFGEDAGRIAGSLEELAHSAAEIVRLGQEAYGGTGGGISGGMGGGQRTFLLDLESDVDRARSLLAGFRTARADADRVVAAVRGAATCLADQIGTLRSLESDIRIVGLNATLKCRRLGDVGRPLSVIAQELRACAHVTAEEADGTKAALEHMMHCVGALSGGGETRHDADIAAVGQAMDASIRHLGASGRSLAAALGVLQRESDTVSGLLSDTQKRLLAHERIGSAIRRAGADLARLAQDSGTSGGTGAAAERMLQRFAQAYTMAQERLVHAQIAGGIAIESPAAAAQGGAAQAGLDDFLF